MRRCWFLAFAAIAGCGRFGFGDVDHRADSAVTNGDGDITGDGGATLRFSYLKPMNTETFDRFGFAIALSADGKTLAVGAPAEDCGIVGVNASDGSNNGVSQSGAVYIFARSGPGWVQQAYIKPSTVDINDAFGAALALSGDGNTLAVGVPNEDSAARTIGGTESDNSALESGAVFVFARTNTTWSQQAYIKSSNSDAGDEFGWAVALTGTGDMLAVGVPQEDGGSMGGGGDPSSNTAMDSGAVITFTRSGATWTQDAYIKPSNTGAGDLFGNTLSIAEDGATLVVGAPAEDSGATIAIGSSTVGSQLDNSVTEGGAAYIFVLGAGMWYQQGYLKPDKIDFGDFFGKVVSISSDGNTVAAASPGEDTIANSGAVSTFTRSADIWTAQQKLKAANAGDNDQFGVSLALSGDGTKLMVGAPFEDSNGISLGGNPNDNSSSDSGAVYAFVRGASWSQTSYSKGNAPDPGDQWGYAVAISRDGTTRSVSAAYEDSAATGINGNALDNTAQDSGCAGVSNY
ncbi:MAG TPA: hypothetical protein VMZ53_24780 [Kofleriaceae bacterium]|nr:hypothetical protein [Kofleriaceae bacterium]